MADVDRYQWRRLIASEHCPLSPTTRLLLHTIAVHMKCDGDSAYPSQARLAQETGLTERCVRKHLDFAARHGWVDRKKKRRPGQRWALYHYVAAVPDALTELIPQHPWDEDPTPELPESGSGNQQGRPELGSGNETQTEPSPESDAERPESDARRPEYDDRFDRNEVPLKYLDKTSRKFSKEGSTKRGSNPLEIHGREKLEQRAAELAKEGLRFNEIAEMMHISPLELHRLLVEI